MPSVWPSSPTIQVHRPKPRSVQALEKALETLQEQFEEIEVVKADVSPLQKAKDSSGSGIPEP